MTLQPALQGLIVAGKLNAPHTLEAFLDYVCPFRSAFIYSILISIFNSTFKSAKFSRAIDNYIIPLISPGGRYDGKIKVVFRLQVQPWHASSTLTHEAGLAVLKSSPDKFWTFSRLLFDNQEDYFDEPTLDLTPRQIRLNLTALAGQVISSEAAESVRQLLTLKGTLNGGNGVTDDLKYNIKFSRQNSIHVSPTVLWDGLIANEVSSSWGEKEWTDFFAAKVMV